MFYFLCSFRKATHTNQTKLWLSVSADSHRFGLRSWELSPSKYINIFVSGGSYYRQIWRRLHFFCRPQCKQSCPISGLKSVSSLGIILGLGGVRMSRRTFGIPTSTPLPSSPPGDKCLTCDSNPLPYYNISVTWQRKPWWNIGHMSGWHNLQSCALYSFGSARQQVGQPIRLSTKGVLGDSDL